MKKLIALCSLPASILAFSIACDDGGAATACETDADCLEGEVCLPVSEVSDELSCVAAECSENSDCQIAFNKGADGALTANASCETAEDCDDGETCAIGFGEAGSCVLNGACPDGTEGAATIDIELAGGGSAQACVDEATQCVEGGCEA